MARRAVLWFRNDLRVRDNLLFHHSQVTEAAETVAIYCLDPRHFQKSPWGDHGRLGPHRARFLAETLVELGQSLQSIGCKLLIAEGKPEDVVPHLLKEGDVLAYQGEDTSEEQDVEIELGRRLPSSMSVVVHYGHTLYHRDDLGFDLAETLPIPFGKFKFGICDKVEVRRELPVPSRGKLPPSPDIDLGDSIKIVAHNVGAIQKVMRCEQVPHLHDAQQGPAIRWIGGEKAALSRLEEYIKPSGLGTYHRTRNQIQGADNSSHLSPWMANGCLSPRTVYWAAKKFERSHDTRKDGLDHVYKFVFELAWRDYFRFYCAHFGKRVFFLGGPAKRKSNWRRHVDVESRWRNGTTGVPLVDALMRELLATGYIANRGRYVVACYLVHYLGIDWRVGADWFERYLLDHDVCSNYGEWASMANVAAAPTRGQPLGLKGRGPTKSSSTGSNGSAGDPWKRGADIGFAIFDPWEQGRQYDKTESYVKRWLPELRMVPTGFAHKPHMLSDSERDRAGCSDYPIPLVMEPFKYPTNAEQQTSGSSRKHRRVDRDRNLDDGKRSATEGGKQESCDGATYYSAHAQRGRCSGYPRHAAGKSGGRRWQARNSSTRKVYMED